MTEHTRKARAIVKKFRTMQYTNKHGWQDKGHVNKEQSEKLALMHVDGIIHALQYNMQYNAGRILYWRKVKKEIQKLQ